jgi:hypothetical protein
MKMPNLKNRSDPTPEQYIAKIKNPYKQAYAAAYLAHMRGCCPEPRPIMIGAMAAQAVRMNLAETLTRR